MRFTGRLTDDELLDELASCRAVCFPPFQEDYGFVTVEAFAARKAVITCRDSGGPAELVKDGVNGFVCEPTPEALGRAMRRLAEDPALAERMGTAAFEAGAKLTWPETVRSSYYNRAVHMAYTSDLETRIAKKVTKAITEHRLIENGDRVMIGLSGGKDSWALIQILDVLQKRAPIDFSLVAVNIDSGYEGYEHHKLTETCAARGWELHVEHTNIGETIEDILDVDATPCSLCARLRRGALYRLADTGRRDQDCARAPRRRLHRDAAPERLLPGRAQGDARAPGLGQRRARRHPSARLRARVRGARVREGSPPCRSSAAAARRAAT